MNHISQIHKLQFELKYLMNHIPKELVYRGQNIHQVRKQKDILKDTLAKKYGIVDPEDINDIIHDLNMQRTNRNSNEIQSNGTLNNKREYKKQIFQDICSNVFKDIMMMLNKKKLNKINSQNYNKSLKYIENHDNNLIS